VPQTVSDIKAAIAKDSTFTEIIKGLIHDNADIASKCKNLYTRYLGEKATIDFDEAREPGTYNGIPIYTRKAKSELKVNHRLHAPFIGKIVTNMTGFIGTVDIGVDQKKYAAPVDPEAEAAKPAPTKTPVQLALDELIKNFIRINSLNKVHSTLVEDATCMGRAYGLAFQSDKDIYLKRLKPWETIVVRNAQTEFPEIGLRYWQMQIAQNETRTYVELYDDTFVYYFLEDRHGNYGVNTDIAPADGTKALAAGKRQHFMGRMPVIEFPKNEQRKGDVELTLSLQDAYNVAISDFSSELAQLRQAYLARKTGTGTIDSQFLEDLKATGILLGEWDFVVKSLNPDAVKHNQGTLKQLVYDLSNSVDFSDPDFNAAMPIIAFRLKCKGLDDSATQIINQFTDSYFYLFEILVAFWTQYRKAPTGLAATDFTVTINKNLPVNTKEVLDNFTNAGGKLSNKTLLDITLPLLGVTHTTEEEESRIEDEGNNEIIAKDEIISNIQTTAGQTANDGAGMKGVPPDMTANGNIDGTTGRSKNNA
jgi:SPP1 family phage portal protein